MKALKNFVHLIGHLGRNVELRSFEGGSKRASTSIATSEYYKNAKGELTSTTTWHNIVAWGKTAEQMVELTKGTQIALQGKISYRKFEAKGQTAYITEIVVEDFHKVEKMKVKEEESIPAAV